MRKSVLGLFVLLWGFLAACSPGPGMEEATFSRPLGPPSVTLEAPSTAAPPTVPSSSSPPSTEAPSTATSTGYLPPRLTETAQGSPESFLALGEHFTHYLESQGLQTADLSFAFLDLHTQRFFGIDVDRHREAASTIKLPAVMYTHEMLQQGLCQADESLQVLPEDLEAGGGTITEAGAGPSYPLSEVLSAMLLDSDNTANRMLFRFWQDRCPERWLVLALDKRYQLQYHETKGLSPKESIRLLQILYENPEQVQGFETIKEQMKATSFRGMGAAKISDPVGHKYGRIAGYMHDIGFVESNRPFLFAVFSKDVPNADSVIADLVEIYDLHGP